MKYFVDVKDISYATIAVEAKRRRRGGSHCEGAVFQRKNQLERGRRHMGSPSR